MLLLELLGIKGMGKHSLGFSKYNRTGHATGRPNENKIRPRPKKNLWFDDDRLWKRDLDHTYNNDFELSSDEDEETVIACNKDRTMAYGRWNKGEKKGITFKKPRPIHTVVHPKMTLKDYIAKG